MTENKNIVQIINSVTDLSESQKQRLLLQETSAKNLLQFFNTYIEKISKQSEIKSLVENVLLQKLQEDDDIPYGVLIKLHEILSKDETEKINPVLKILEATVKQPEMIIPQQNSNNLNLKEEKDNITNVTPEEMRGIKHLLSMINDLEKSEFSKK